jgi:hypothetical protein
LNIKDEKTIIRCDDVFVDTDYKHFEKICDLVNKYDFYHLIAVCPLGKGSRLWNSNKTVLKMPVIKSIPLINGYIRKITGEEYIGRNKDLVELLNVQFSKNKVIPCLHGLHHYRYNVLSAQSTWEELSIGKKIMKKLFNADVKIFAPPFNAWDQKTQLACESLNLEIDHCFTAFDLLIQKSNNQQIENLAKKQAPIREVLYHPYSLNLEKFEQYLKARRKYC